jgi:hypothetical protein
MGAYGRFELRYVRTDRNGTKYFLDDNCPRCSGYGELDKWIETGRVCFACGGTGRRPQPKTVKVYTPEHEAKLEARRAARAPKKSAEELEKARRLVEETRINAWIDEGFDRNGVGYLHTGNTYKNREALKRSGGRWNIFLRGYIAPVKVELVGVAIREVSAAELCTPGGYIDTEKAWALKKALEA